MINVVLPLPNPHDIAAALSRTFGDAKVKLHILAPNYGMVPLSRDGIANMLKEMAEAVQNLERAVYFLILSGHPIANIGAYMLMKQRFGKLGLLIYDSRRRKYFVLEDLPFEVQNFIHSDSTNLDKNV